MFDYNQMALHRQTFERLACLFKENVYFFHTHAPLSSVFLPLPHKYQLLKPLIQRLTRKNNFNLASEIQSFEVNQTEKELRFQSQIITSNSIYGIKFDKDTQFLILKKDSGRLQISKQLGEGDLFGVFLFSGVKGSDIRYLNGSLSKLNQILLKLFVLLSAFSLCKVIEVATRPQNFDKLDQKKMK